LAPPPAISGTCASHPRVPCHARPVARPYPPRPPSNPGPISPQIHHCRRRRELRRCRDSSSPVKSSSIPRMGIFPSSSSSDSPPYPALSLTVQGRRRTAPPAAAYHRCATPSSPFSARAATGEVRRGRLHAMRVLALLRSPPRPPLPASRRGARAARVGAPRRRVLALTGLGGAPARGTRLSASGLRVWPGPGTPSVF
jgi:hypothetical protein